MEFKTPILFLIFNRADTTLLVFNKIREIRPKQLFIAADGPRIDIPDDELKCIQTRKMVESIDWYCEVKYLFREQNLGCGLAVSQGITWFFEHVEQGIILEDDCLPDLSFFSFCESMLSKYKDTIKVGSITGTNHLLGKFADENTYFFSNLNGIWGWATWKRTWDEYSYNISDSVIEIEKTLSLSISDKQICNYFKSMLESQKSKKLNTWDIQLLYMMCKKNFYCIVPTNNLITNIGLLGTHTENTKVLHPFFNMKLEPIDLERIKHPDNYTIETKYEKMRKKIIVKYGIEEYPKPALVKSLFDQIRKYIF